MNKRLVALTLLALTTTVACKKEGCTDPLAENYSEKAKTDDGSCTYGEDVVSQEITEDITTPTVIEDKTVKVCGDIYVSSELTLQPGATLIMCAGASITIEETAYLSAVGTADNPIVIKGETETAGFWEGIAIKSNNPNNKLIHVTVKDAGTYWGWEFANVFVDNGSKLEMSNCTISNSDDFGLFVADGSSLTNFSNNTFSNNVTGLNVSVKHVASLDANSNYNQSNTNNYVHVRSGTIETDAVWQALSTPLLIHGVYVEAGLTMNAGLNCQMEASSFFQVESTGFMKAVGTASNPITISGKFASAAYWDGLKIGSNNPNNELKFVQISDGGSYWGYEYSNIHLSGSLIIDDCTISNANSWGLYVAGSSTITSGGAVQTDASGVESNNTFSGNGNGADADCTSGCGVFFD